MKKFDLLHVLGLGVEIEMYRKDKVLPSSPHAAGDRAQGRAQIRADDTAKPGEC